MKILSFVSVIGLSFALSCPLSAAEAPLPKIVRIYPPGGQKGTSVTVEILGEFLSNAQSIEFDCQDLVWTKTLSTSSAKITGVISILPHATLGPHLLRVLTLDGPSTSAMFNVGQFPSILEIESNDRPEQAQPIPSLPAEIQGRLDGSADIDYYAFHVRAGERWIFDFRSIEYGSSVEAKMTLLDAQANRVAFNDDRDDFDETPFLEHTFDTGGTYSIKLDQYRGPRGFNFGKNCAYTLRISALPCIYYTAPFGARVGRTTRIKLFGTALDKLEKVYLTELRRGEYTRMTYPYTMPIHFRPDPPSTSQLARIDGKVISRRLDRAEALFTIPTATRTGLWQLWTEGLQGISDGVKIELTDVSEYDETGVPKAVWAQEEMAINGSLQRPKEEDVYQINAVAGQPLHCWTLAAQLGVPHLDTVLELRDASGKKLAENDDVVAGQGTLIGNPDSSLFYTPTQDGPLTLLVKDRVGRGGPGYQYRLKLKSEKPGFQLVTTPENFTVPKGGSAEIKVHLVREAGFEGEVSVWFEGMPPGVAAPRGKFRADQRFEPNADGADMIIPEIAFRIQLPESLQPGVYPVHVQGVSAAEEAGPERLVQAQSTLMIGPILDLWNFIRRPLPYISMTVIEPFEVRLSAEVPSVDLQRGTTVTLDLKAENLPKDSNVQVVNLPSGVTYRLIRWQNDQITLSLEAAPDASLGLFDISAEAQIGNRWAPTRPIPLTVSPAPEVSHRRGAR
ncbi:MAG: hypothetical protein DMG05_00380 [Acidobacteria bacterium]|nr:MAG: hypothetical protein DMG05_00380 [Acidobacteriota bacterium]